MLLMFILLCIAAAPAFFPKYRPQPLTDFDSLQIKDHDVAAKAFTVITLNEKDTFFKPPPEGAPAAPAADAAAASDPTGRRLTEAFTGRSGTCTRSHMQQIPYFSPKRLGFFPFLLCMHSLQCMRCISVEASPSSN
jgi:hypothetical protein